MGFAIHPNKLSERQKTVANFIQKASPKFRDGWTGHFFQLPTFEKSNLAQFVACQFRNIFFVQFITQFYRTGFKRQIVKNAQI